MGTASRSTMVLPVNGLTRYLRIRITTYDDSLVVEDRRTLFGVIPLRRRRVEIPCEELASGEVHNMVRVTALAAAAALLGAVFLFDPPVVADAVLGLLAAPFAFLAFVRALRLERTDGRHWTFPMCRYYTFDAELALLDAVETSRSLHRGSGTPVAT